MSKLIPEIMIPFLAGSNSFIQRNGRKGFDDFRDDFFDLHTDSERKQHNHIEMVENLLKLIELYPQLNGPLSRLLLRYYFRLEANGQAPRTLKGWLLQKLVATANGESPNEVWGYNNKNGVRKTSGRLHNPLMIIAYHEIVRRTGANKTQCQEKCYERFNVSKPTILGYLKGFEATLEKLSDKTLLFYSENDVLSDVFESR
jgi:hypothetical protein